MKSPNISLMKNGDIWLPGAASDVAKQVDWLFYFIMALSAVVFTIVLVVGIYFLFKYRRSETNQEASAHVEHNVALEIIWSVIPLILLMVIFVIGFKGYLNLSVAPQDSLEIRVTGQKWRWSFEYPESGVKTANDFTVPVGVPVKLIMSSTDVLHSFYLPNFRQKMDVIPNRYTTVWFKANEVGSYQVFCTEYCGDLHSQMLANLHVVSQSDYEAFLTESKVEDTSTPLNVLGEKLYVSESCNTCHSIDGTKKIGPTWKGLYGAKRSFVKGGSATADDNYLRESIVEPNKHVVAGYAPVMPTYKGQLSDRQMNAIIEYIKTLK